MERPSAAVFPVLPRLRMSVAFFALCDYLLVGRINSVKQTAGRAWDYRTLGRLGQKEVTATRRRLIAEAEVLVRTRGFAGFSYADLAKAVGLSKATIHHHFPAKEDLGAALIANYKERYDAALDAIWKKSTSGIARIEAYAKLYLDGVRQDQGCLCGVMASERDILPQRLRYGIARFFEEHLVWLQRVLEAGIENGTIRPGVDPAPQAKLVLSALEGMIMLGRLFGDKSSFDTSADALGKSLLNYAADPFER
ncbi:MAG TPA: TetR/AcrR family transcriptional regulator [Methylocella sp.]|nr:TetR/AcrR family transcriptional regulator [Methylocella sp.]